MKINTASRTATVSFDPEKTSVEELIRALEADGFNDGDVLWICGQRYNVMLGTEIESRAHCTHICCNDISLQTKAFQCLTECLDQCNTPACSGN